MITEKISWDTLSFIKLVGFCQQYMFLDFIKEKQAFLPLPLKSNVEMLQTESLTFKNQWWIQGRGRGPSAPLIFRPNWGPKDWKKFLETAPLFCKGLNNPPPPHWKWPIGDNKKKPNLVGGVGGGESPDFFWKCTPFHDSISTLLLLSVMSATDVI